MDRPEAGATLAITFIYCRDLPAAMRFYEDVLGLTLAVDQGWSKIYRICPGAHVGLVDETRGMHRWAEEKPVQICLRVPDVAAWYRYATARGLPGLSRLSENDALGILAFVFNDPEGYQIEIQSATREGGLKGRAHIVINPDSTVRVARGSTRTAFNRTKETNREANR